MAIPTVWMYRQGHEHEPVITKKLGTQPISFGRTLLVDFPAGFEFLLPRTISNWLFAKFTKVRSAGDVDSLMRRSSGIAVWNAEVAVSIPERASDVSDSRVARNFSAPAFLGRFSKLHDGHVVLKTEDGIVVHHKNGKSLVSRVALHGRPQRYSFKGQVRDGTWAF